MDSLEINKKHKEQKKKEKAKLKKQKQIEKNNLKRLKVKERKQRRQEKSQYARFVRKCRKENPIIAKMIAKIRDKRTCQWCGSKENIHGSHIINVARDHRLACNPDNIKALCYNCHLDKWHKDPILAAEWFKSAFPGRRERLKLKHIENQKLGSISHLWIEDTNKKLKEQYKEMTGKEWI